MRVLYVIDSLANGGAERSLAAMAPAYALHGLGLEVVTLWERPGGVHEQVAAAVPVTVLKSATRRGRVSELHAVVAARRPDIVHSTLFEADLTARLDWSRRRPALVCSLVSDSYGPAHLAASGVSPWKMRAAQAVDAVTARRVSRFHAVAEHLATSMHRRLAIPLSRIEVVPRGRDPEGLGVRTSARRQAAREALGVGPDHRLVVAAARQERQKGLDVLLDAWPAVTALVPSARLVVAGREGRASGGLRRQAAEVGAQLLGDRSDVAELLCAADAFAFPSRMEGAGGALLEAMALEAPIVASDLPPLREVLEGIGTLVPPDDVPAFADALVTVLCEPPTARTAAARQRFLSRYTVEAVVGQLAGLYRRAVA